jgi:branched-chain amino acid transport system ATP-binding protein
MSTNTASAAHAGQPLLGVQNISLSFGGVKAVTDISFDVHAGEILSIIGPNGAGKSSLLNVISGVYEAQQGTLSLHGRPLRQWHPRQAAQNGMARTFQNLALFKGLSVLDNVLTGRSLVGGSNTWGQALRWPSARRHEAAQVEVAEQVIAFLQLQSIRHSPVGSLSYGQQKRVEFARALAARPRILLLDEPMAGMSVQEKQAMARAIVEVNRTHGTTIVLIEHDMGVVMDISDRVVVLDYGKKIADGPPDTVRASQAVIDAYLGVAH